MKTSVKILVLILAVVLTIWLALSAVSRDVVAGRAVKGTASDAVTGTVKVFANMDIKVKTEVEGRIAETPLAAGAAVKKGDAIMILDSEDLNNEIRANVIQLKAARERLRLSLPQEQDLLSLTEEIERLKRQVEFGGASNADLERRQRDLAKLQTDISYQKINREEQAGLFETTVARLQGRLARMTVESPMDGTVIEQYKWTGDYVWGGNEIFRVVSNGRWLELTLAEEDCANVVAGQKATVRLASYPDRTFIGTVTGLSAFSNADSKTRTVFLTINEPDEILVPGLTGEAVLVRAEHKDAVLIPRRALVGNRVYVVKAGRVDIRRVQSGYVGLDQAEIVSGVASGETVILEDQGALRQGDKVHAVQEDSSN